MYFVDACTIWCIGKYPTVRSILLSHKYVCLLCFKNPVGLTGPTYQPRQRSCVQQSTITCNGEVPLAKIKMHLFPHLHKTNQEDKSSPIIGHIYTELLIKREITERWGETANISSSNSNVDSGDKMVTSCLRITSKDIEISIVLA